jgi:hypothetical protein
MGVIRKFLSRHGQNFGIPLPNSEDSPSAEAKDKLRRMGVKGLKKGGSASSRADGCAQRGKTKGRMV